MTRKDNGKHLEILPTLTFALDHIREISALMLICEFSYIVFWCVTVEVSKFLPETIPVV